MSTEILSQDGLLKSPLVSVLSCNRRARLSEVRTPAGCDRHPRSALRLSNSPQAAQLNSVVWTAPPDALLSSIEPFDRVKAIDWDGEQYYWLKAAKSAAGYPPEISIPWIMMTRAR